MRKVSLVEGKGLSMSQAQSISNLCNQTAREIENVLKNTNTYSKYVLIEGVKHQVRKPKPLPTLDTVVELLTRKAKLYACQAFLMENIKAKDYLLMKLKTQTPDLSVVEKPNRPDLFYPQEKEMVSEEWGWEQLTKGEINEFLEAEAYAAHFGQFIHKDSILDKLRDEISYIPDIDWMELNTGAKTPVFFQPHHTSKELTDMHVFLSKIHRKYEQKVNYFNAKVKNLVTEENRVRSEFNKAQLLESETKNREINKKYEDEINKYNIAVDKIKKDFEVQRNIDLKKVASMRINVDSRFQEIVDFFLNDLNSGDTEQK